MTIMKKISNSFLLMSLLAIVFSCVDESLDPLQFANMQKGTLIALRGQALKSLYVNGEPIADIVPLIADGTEKFVYETEVLATDPSTVASVDIFVIKKTGTTTTRVPLKNIPASAFVKGAYPNPSATIELGISEVLTALGLTPTYPLSVADRNTLLNTYKFGIGIESDLNLTDGTKVLAADIVASGLFQSNQFYPAMILNWAITNYCEYTDDWAGTYTVIEIYSNGSSDPYELTLTPVGGFPHRFSTDNFWGSNMDAYLEFTPSTNPKNQIVLFPTQDNGDGEIKSTKGSYDECLKTFKIQTQYDGEDWRYEFKRNN